MVPLLIGIRNGFINGKNNALVLIEIFNLHHNDGWENNKIGGV